MKITENPAISGFRFTRVLLIVLREGVIVNVPIESAECGIEGYFLEGEYIYGDCDQDCFDLDLFLYDAVLNSCLISCLPPTQSLVSANCLHQQTKLTCRKLRIEDSVILKLT